MRRAGDDVDVPRAHPRALLCKPEAFLAADDLLLASLTLGDVVRDLERAELRAVAGAVRALRREEDARLVAERAALLERLGRPAFEDQPVGLGHRIRERTGRHLLDRVADQLLAGPAERLSPHLR